MFPTTQVAVVVLFLFLRLLNNDGFEKEGFYNILTMAFIYGWIGFVSVYVPYSIAPSHKVIASSICSLMICVEIFYVLYAMSLKALQNWWIITSFIVAAFSFVTAAIICVVLNYRNKK